MRSNILFPCVAGAALLFASACADDPDVPAAGLPGVYQATSFTVAAPGAPAVNLLAAGAALRISLGSDHNTSGRLTVPATVTGGPAIDESLAGSWRESHDTVYFDGPADTFVRDVPFIVRGATLSAEEVAPELHLQVTLSKQ